MSNTITPTVFHRTLNMEGLGNLLSRSRSPGGSLWLQRQRDTPLYYGAIFAVAGSIGLLFIPGKRNPSAICA